MASSVLHPPVESAILGRHWRLRDELAARGYRDLRDVPETDIGDGLPRRIWSATRNGEALVDPKSALSLAASLEWMLERRPQKA